MFVGLRAVQIFASPVVIPAATTRAQYGGSQSLVREPQGFARNQSFIKAVWLWPALFLESEDLLSFPLYHFNYLFPGKIIFLLRKSEKKYRTRPRAEPDSRLRLSPPVPDHKQNKVADTVVQGSWEPRQISQSYRKYLLFHNCDNRKVCIKWKHGNAKVF